VTVMTALWGAWPSGHAAPSCVARGARGTHPPVWRPRAPTFTAVIGCARRPAADVQPGSVSGARLMCLRAQMTAMFSALRRGSGDTDPLGTLRWDLAGSAGTRPAAGAAVPVLLRQILARLPGGFAAQRCRQRPGSGPRGGGQDGEANDGQLHGESPFTNSCGHGPRRDEGPVHDAYLERPCSPHAQTSRCGEAPAVPCLRRGGLTAGPGPQAAM
jgi:hypothetical protein